MQAAPPDGSAHRTNPLGFVVGAIKAVGNMVLPLVFVAYQARDEAWGIAVIIGVAVLIAAIVFGLSFLDWRMRTYRVGDTDIRVDSGIVSRTARSVPFERIQDVSLEQSLLPRLFGLVEVRFETGAGGKDELKLAYLAAAEGERLREVIRARKMDVDSASGIAATTDAAPRAEPPPLFAMPPKRVLTFGLFEFSLIVVAVVGGAAQQFDFLLPFDIWDFDEWQARLAGPGAQLAGLGATAQVIGGAIAIGSLVVLGVGTGIVRTVLRDWNFRLDRTDKGFRRRRGLLTRTDVVMPVHRVQALVQSTGIIRSRFGWHGLKFVSLAQDSGSASHDVAPFATQAELTPIIAASGFARPDDTLFWHRTSLKARIDKICVIAAFFLAFAAVLYGVLGLAEFDRRLAWLPVAGGALLIVREGFLHRFDRFGWDGNQVYVRAGWLARKLRTAARVKLNSVEIVRGPLAKRRGYADLHLGLAGGNFSIENLPMTDAVALRDAVLTSIARLDFSRLGGATPPLPLATDES